MFSSESFTLRGENLEVLIYMDHDVSPPKQQTMVPWEIKLDR